ncbi:MAG TPA: DoxX family protein [Chloroflexota bacterium]|nr:DoxX family protein [Chloroflexota bacterium]
MASDWGLLFVRVVVGFFLFGHGTQKLFGWFGGRGLRATIAGMGTNLRLRPAVVWGMLAGVTEAGGGLLFGLGLLSPLGSLGIIAAMLMASVLAHWGKLWASNRGMEFPLSNLAIAVAVGLIGPGSYSLDAALGIALPEPLSIEVGVGLVLIGTALAIVSRTPRPSPAPTHLGDQTAASRP